ncbi:thermonuclease family protein [uncultured Alsobacter sp.]|uniref:thermonuclease family protein n=1 Tax=uncultured Alsobacter sp. TaxID=1748258 RepID=UPI0025D29372|nr:thermonuclease family protein [uncultured Alsobacter sp.]
MPRCRILPVVIALLAALDASAAVPETPAGWSACLPRRGSTAESLAPAGGLDLVRGRGGSVRLAGIEAPPPGAGIAALTLAAALEARLAGIPASVEPLGPADRWDRIPALVALAGQPLAALLVRDGLARVRPDETPPVCLRQLLRLEEEARRARRGLWAEADAVLDAGAVAGRPDLHGRFTIVEGRVSRLGHGRVNIYLNFGTISRHDLSVTVQKRALQRLEASGMTWSSIEGRRVRVRGIVAGTGRPTLAVGRPEEIERLD